MAISYKSRQVSTGDSVVSTANAAGALTYAAAGAGVSHVLGRVDYSLSGAGTGFLQIEDGSGNIVFKQAITAAGPGFVSFSDYPKRGTPNTAMIITMTAAGSGVIATANATHWTE